MAVNLAIESFIAKLIDKYLKINSKWGKMEFVSLVMQSFKIEIAYSFNPNNKKYF